MEIVGDDLWVASGHRSRVSAGIPMLGILTKNGTTVGTGPAWSTSAREISPRGYGADISGM
ncbi:MAG: hypothetical protein ACJZ5P_06685 [Candidatus Thalassarchaeaceae archaeon]